MNEILRSTYKQLFFRLFLTVGISFLSVSCTHGPVEVVEQTAGTDIVAELNVSLRLSGGLQTMAGDYTLDGTDPENRISHLTAVVVDLDAAGQEVPARCAYAEIHSPGSSSVTFRIYTTSGSKHIYVVANADARRVVAAISGQQPLTTSGQSYETAISEFLTLSASATVGENRQGSSIVMSGQAYISGQSDPMRIDLPEPILPGAVSVVSGLEAKLERCVAKVLFTCRMAESKSGGEQGGKYVLIRDPQSTQHAASPDDVNNDYNGWMNIEDVWFTLNNTSRQTYIMQRTQTDGGRMYVTDPDFALSEYLHRVDGVYTPITTGNLYADHFVSLGPSDLELPRQVAGIPFSSSTCRMRALPYDAARANQADPDNHYTEGLYCLENTVHNDLTDLSEDEKQSVPRMGSTYVVVAARYVPKFIYDATVAPSGSDIEGRLCADYAAALTMLAPVAGVDRDGNATTYPEGTFFYYHDGSQIRFCTYAGMMKWIELSQGTLKPLSRNDFNEYVAGWGYYSTFVNGVQASAADAYGRRPLLFKDNDGVVRNTYYLLQASLFYVPGSNLPTEDLIMVNSTRLDWMPHGSTDVVVRPE